MPIPDKSPVFQPVFANDWGQLPPVFQKRYAHRGQCRDTVVLTGVMQFHASRWARVLSPLLRLRGMPPMFTAKDVPVTVRLTGQGEAGTVHFSREFAVQNRKKSIMFDTLQQLAEDGEVIDWTRGAVGWVAAYRYQDNTVRMAHRGYRWRIFGKSVAVPLEKLLGTCSVWEKAENDNRFTMRMEMRRANGKLFYGYSGTFDIAGVMRKD